MKHLVAFLLRVGRSDDERVSLLGDLEEERRTRLARGSGRLLVFAWYTAEVLRAFLWGLRDAHPPSFASWPDIKLSLRLLIRTPA